VAIKAMKRTTILLSCFLLAAALAFLAGCRARLEPPAAAALPVL